MAEQAAFIIATLDVDGETPKGDKLTLIGRAMPYQGFNLEGSMRMETTWYPGNAVATIQMLGAEEKPTTIHGMWKDKFLRQFTDDIIPKAVQPTAVALLNAQALPDVDNLIKAVENMRLAGQMLKVTWGSLTRIGVMTRFKQNWIRFEDVEWEMEFQWISRGEKQTPITSSVPPEALSFSRTLDALVDQLKAAVDVGVGLVNTITVPFQVIESFTEAVSDSVRVIEAAAAEMTGAVENATQLISVPQDAAARALAASESIKSESGAIVTTVEGVPPLELIKTGDPAALDLSNALQADTYGRGIKAAARALQAFVAAQGDDLRASLDIDALLAVFIARAPMDLRDVSQKYYRTPDEWRRLLAYNHLTSSALSIGALVLVPKLVSEDGRT
jgi:hypothetical protein